MKFRVTETWQATYADPIRLEAGDMLYLTGRQEVWEGHVWLWARSADGLEGWIPDSIVRQGEIGHIATESYTAAELTCRAGQIVSGAKETHGWVFCTLPDGSAGWVPRRNLTPDVT
jgi:hypothetical protein